MRYLYGDSTPFPLNTNFLETAMAATDAAVSLLRLEDSLQEVRRTEEETRARASRRSAEVTAVEACMRDALREAGGVSGAGEELVDKLTAVIERELDGARQHIRLWQDKVLTGASQRRQTPAQLHQPLERFFQREELPGTKWGMRWKASGQNAAMAQVYAVTPMGLTATLAVDIPNKHLWTKPFRLSEVQRELVVQMMGKGWFGRTKMRKEKLHKYYVTRVTCTADREVLVLHKKVSDQGEGIRVTLRERDDKTVRAVRVDGNEDEIGEVECFAGLEATLLKRAWRSMISTLEPLLKQRGKLLAAMLDGRDIAKVDSPALLAAVFIQSVGPIVRQLTRHSRSSGELQLKRELGDGRREELFVRYADLSDKYAELSPVSRDMFSAYGLDPNAMTMPPPPMHEPMVVESDPTYELPAHMAFFPPQDENAITQLDVQGPTHTHPNLSPMAYQALQTVESYPQSGRSSGLGLVPASVPQPASMPQPASVPPISEWDDDEDEVETLTGHYGRPRIRSDIAPRRSPTPPAFERASAYGHGYHAQLLPPAPRPANNVVALPPAPATIPPPPPRRQQQDLNAVTRRERPELRLASG